MRLYFAAILGLGDDEAYYWEWARHLAWSYFDQPPMVAFLVWLFASWGGDTELMVRLGNILLSLMATVFAYLWAKDIFEEEKAALWAVLLVSIVPIFALGAIFIFPDGPLGAFWISTLFLLHKALRTQKPLFWYLAGLTWGLALLSKYNGVLLGLIVLVYLLAVKEDRFWLRRKEPYIASAIALLIFSPVLIWNYQNGFVSFLFHLTHTGSKASSWQSFLLFLFPPFGYLSPLVYLGAWWALWWVLREGRRRRSTKLLFLSVSSLVPLIFFAVVSFKGKFKPHYPALGFYPALIAFAGISMSSGASRRRRRFFIIAFSFCLIFIAGMLASTQWPITSRAIMAFKSVASNLHWGDFKPKLERLSVRNDETNDLYGWPQAALQAREIYASLEQEGRVFIFAERYQIASPLAFYLGRRSKVYCLSSRRDQYKYFSPPAAAGSGSGEAVSSSGESQVSLSGRSWKEKINKFTVRKKHEATKNFLAEVSGLRGQNALFVCDSRYFVDPLKKFDFKKVLLEKSLVIKRSDLEVRTFYFYKCYDFQGLQSDKE